MKILKTNINQIVIMKIEKKYLGLRIITFPLKLAFIIFWNIVFSVIVCVKWVLHSSTEVYFFKQSSKADLIKLIDQNEKIIKHLNL